MKGKVLAYRYALILVIGLVSTLVLTLSWPRLRASLLYLPVDTAISKYRQTGELDVAQLDGLIERAQDSIAIHDHYRYWEGVSELHILSSQVMSRTVWDRRMALEDSILAANEVVRRAPSKPRSWLRIARAGEFLAYPHEQVIPALKMSILTGRVEPTLMLTRLELGLRYMPVLEQDAVLLLRDQAILTWAINDRAMVERIRTGFLSPALLRELLSGHNEAIMAEIEARL